ncbi:MAG: sigma-54-dependent Fis family transcriptional regulator [Myxococcota bacterium]|nr:sigma-54-dependent Fis family transcriptional regulator [Myxococcota bacterium]
MKTPFAARSYETVDPGNGNLLFGVGATPLGVRKTGPSWSRIVRRRNRLVEEFERIRRERDLYRRLLELGAEVEASAEVDPFLREALACVVALTGAIQGYLEIRDEGSEQGDGRWAMTHGCSGDDVDRIRSSISSSIMAEALATGQTVSTHSALIDPRFQKQESVQRERIEAVLCAPVHGDEAVGVVYLQGREKPGPFSEEDRRAAECFARHLAPLAGSLLLRRRIAAASDPTASLRQSHRLEGIVGRSPALAAALEQAMLAAPLDVNVLLTGECGTGKSQLARAIHENGLRSSGPFVELNCATFPATLLESELFGSLKGAHNQANTDRPGKVAAAENGTLFLDEVAELPAEAQAKLLQLLQSRTYYPLGGNALVQANVRIVAATNIDLGQALHEKKLREDLYYRLQVLQIRLPSLQERREDLPQLARALCGRACDRHRMPALELSPGALRAVGAAEWPGNVRQLENAIEAAVIRAGGRHAARVEARHVFPDSPGAGEPEAEAPTFQEATHRFQGELLREALESADWNVSEAARRLDLARSHVYNLVKVHGLTRDDSE